MSDAATEIDARQADIHRRMGPAGRLRAAVEASLLARSLLLARLRAEHPDWREAELLRELLRLAVLPEELPADLPRVPADGRVAGTR